MQKKILDYIFNLSVKRGKLLLVIIAVITVILGAFIPRLIISSSQQNLIPKNDPEQARYIQYNKEFGSSENLIIILEGDSDHCKQVADDVAQELEKEQKWVKSVFYKIDTSVLIKRAPLYISLEDLKKGVGILQAKKTWIDKMQNVSNLYGLLQAITVSFKEPNADISPDTAAKIIKFLNALFQEWNDWLANPNQHKLKIAQKLSMAGFAEMANLQSDGYLFSRDFNMMFFFVQPRNYVDEITYLKPFMTDISKACDRALKAHPEVQGKIKIAYTGMPAHVLTETEIIYSDVGSAGLASVVIVTLVLLIGFRSIKKTIIGVIPTVTGLVISLGLITIINGKLNLISSSFLAVLFGIGIDFGIYLLQRTEEELGNGLSQNDAIYKAVVLTSRSIISGGITTSLAFFALYLSSFQGYSELGMAAGIGLVVVLLTTFLMMPTLLMLIPIEARDYHLKETVTETVKLERKKVHLVIIGVGVLITIASIVATTRIKMDYNVLKMMPSNSESTIYQLKMEDNSDYKMSFAMITDKDLNNLKAITDKVKNLPTVSKVDSLAELIPADQDEKIKVIRKYKPILGNFRITLKDNNQESADYFAVLDQMSAFFEDAQEKAFAGGQTKLVEQIDTLMKNMDALKGRLSKDKNGVDLARTKKFEKELFHNIEKGTQIIRESFNPTKITEETFPKEIISRFKSPQGTYVAMVSPRGSIWDIDFLDKFVNDLKKITPNVTGFPVTHRVYVRQAASAVVEAMMWSFIVILLLLIFDFRKVNEVLLALMPLIIGMLWLQLVLFVLGIDYNVANIAGLPLLLGLGIVYGLRMVHRWREDKTITAFAATKTTGKGLAFAALAIMVGLFSIVPARHNGVSAFGLILFIGIISCVFTALIILPAAIDYIYLLKNKDGGPNIEEAEPEAVSVTKRPETMKKASQPKSKKQANKGKGVKAKKMAKKAAKKKK
ncbi:MAG TPA: MMPL family transporter [Spirochaetota bacterium]|mgnify:CR=1 FL=1|nr:MMPL family transporter [Spirochaetota bacterium]HPL15258.1 MMPL family transporter [Spirochaetota bacterium]HQF06877.1 MMPL family transporter [Spirochaetota bacterium]HQH95504.1 MMPL family transporter [Spirochaetota bacterium]HQJ69082.1 MMPL family transporter [Spirochaetota bacterium]